uniref:Uncharacterized protein n=1 Tax=Triticum urartu TaxID=4572 RepID=A0A8R7PIK0_TRIUA
MLDDVSLSPALINGCLPLCFPILQLPCIYASSLTFFNPATKHPSTIQHGALLGVVHTGLCSIDSGRSWRLDVAFFYFRNSQLISPMVSRAGNYFRCTARPYLLPSIFCIVYDCLDYVFLS